MPAQRLDHPALQEARDLHRVVAVRRREQLPAVAVQDLMLMEFRVRSRG